MDNLKGEAPHPENSWVRDEVRQLLTKYGLGAQKNLGQHFLIDADALRGILRAADLKSDDVVVEVGPGLGVLTRGLVENVKKVFAVEKDEKLAEILKGEFFSSENLEIVGGDILEVDASRFGEGYKVVANLPYYITSKIIRYFLTSEQPPRELVLLVQKEVAERIIAKKGKMSLLSISVHFYGSPSLIDIVPRTSFWPAPKVDSAILRIVLKDDFVKKIDDHKAFFRLIKAGFSEKRKTLVNALSGGLQMEKGEVEAELNKINIDNKVRAEDLDLDAWEKIYKTFKERIAR